MLSDNGFQRSHKYLVRRPTIDDAAEMGRLHVGVWRETYVGMMSEEALARLDPDSSAQRWARIAEAATDLTADGINGPLTLVAVHRASSALVGFATAGPSRNVSPPTPIQLWAINVLAGHHGSGVAGLLLSETLGDRPGYLWVVEQNARARAFYRRRGFVEDGTTVHDDDLGADEVRMVRF